MRSYQVRLVVGVVAALVALGALSACSSDTPSASGTSSSPAAAMSQSASPSMTKVPAVSGVDLKTATTPLGDIVVDGNGMTAYFYDKDTAGSGTSACAGGCLAAWPPIETTSATPVVDGVTGTVGTIKDAAGNLQVTINGLPIYTYAEDTAAGQTNGQGSGGIWWVISPSGAKITAAGGSGY